MAERKFKISHIVLISGLTLVLASAAKFYHYNFIANTPGQARTLQLAGLQASMCKGELYKIGAADQCGRRSIFIDPDWGVTAYFTIYGVDSREEAEAIARFMAEARHASKQDHIPISLDVYSVPRSSGKQGPVDTKYIIYHKNF